MHGCKRASHLHKFQSETIWPGPISLRSEWKVPYLVRRWTVAAPSGFIPRSHRERLDRALLQPGEVSGQVRFSEIADALTVDNLGAVYAPQLISIVEINRGYPAIADK